MTEPDGVLSGQVIISRIVQADDVLIVVEDGGLPVLEAVGMLAMATDSILHPELDDYQEGN